MTLHVRHMPSEPKPRVSDRRRRGAGQIHRDQPRPDVMFGDLVTQAGEAARDLTLRVVTPEGEYIARSAHVEQNPDGSFQVVLYTGIKRTPSW